MNNKSEYEHKLDEYLIPLILNKNKVKILEFGVQNGISTKKFLEVCEKNDGKLYSADIIDCSKLFDNRRWKFIKSRDDNFQLIKSIIPEKIDVIYLDSLHEASHIQKIFYAYYQLLNVNGYFFIDDISHLPYLKNKSRNNFYCEINNKETFEEILNIYDSNVDNFDLNFTFISSGLAIIKKKTDLPLNVKNVIKIRENSPKNIIRLLWKKIIKN